MAEISRGRVTITLGGTGQVVKRSAAVTDDSLTGAGNKRSVRDRIGSSQLDGSLPFESPVSNQKRHRGEIYSTSLSTSTVEDVRIGKNDLRFKLMEKTESRRVQSDDDRKTVDLREKLSTRTVQHPAPFYSHPHSRQLIPQRKDHGILGQFPPAISAEDLSMVNSSRSSYSVSTLDQIRRSPIRVLCSSRGLSPPRNVAELARMPLKRTYDDLGTISYVNRDVSVAPRSVSSSTSFITSSTVPSASSNPLGPLKSQFPPPSGIVPKSSYMGGEQQTVEGLLNSLGLEKYVVIFKAEEVDMTALKQMGESDLKDLGIPMGPRKKILLAVSTHSKRQS